MRLLGELSFWLVIFFFFNDTATTEIYTLSLHDALPIFAVQFITRLASRWWVSRILRVDIDRKSTRLNSSHLRISYAVFCLKKKKHEKDTQREIEHKKEEQRQCEQDQQRQHTQEELFFNAAPAQENQHFHQQERFPA